MTPAYIAPPKTVTTPTLDTTATKLPARNLNPASTALENWKSKHESTPGYRRGQAAAPGAAVIVAEVSSFMQIPALLKEMATRDPNSDSPKIRFTFPAPAKGGEHEAQIRAEQIKISKFLEANSGKSYREICTSLEHPLAEADSFKQFKAKGISAAEWIKAHKMPTDDDSMSRSMNVRAVHDVNRAGAKGIDAIKDLLVNISKGLLTKGSAPILIVDKDKVSDLAQSLKAHLEDNPQSKLKEATIYVGSCRSSLNGTPITQEDCNGVSKMSVDEFLKKAYSGASDDTAQPQTKSKKVLDEDLRVSPVIQRGSLSLVEYAKSIKDLPLPRLPQSLTRAA
jgi:hypothetical protein